MKPGLGRCKRPLRNNNQASNSSSLMPMSKSVDVTSYHQNPKIPHQANICRPHLHNSRESSRCNGAGCHGHRAACALRAIPNASFAREPLEITGDGAETLIAQKLLNSMSAAGFSTASSGATVSPAGLSTASSGATVSLGAACPATVSRATVSCFTVCRATMSLPTHAVQALSSQAWAHQGKDAHASPRATSMHSLGRWLSVLVAHVSVQLFLCLRPIRRAMLALEQALCHVFFSMSSVRLRIRAKVNMRATAARTGKIQILYPTKIPLTPTGPHPTSSQKRERAPGASPAKNGHTPSAQLRPHVKTARHLKLAHVERAVHTTSLNQTGGAPQKKNSTFSLLL